MLDPMNSHSLMKIPEKIPSLAFYPHFDIAKNPWQPIESPPGSGFRH